MGKAVDVAKRLNYARQVWAAVGVLPAAVERLMRERGVGRRQAYRDLRRARRLKRPVPIPDPTIAYTVKLSRGVVRRLRAHAEATDRTISDIVSRAIVAQLARSGGRD